MNNDTSNRLRGPVRLSSNGKVAVVAGPSEARQPNPADLIEGARRFKRLALNALTIDYADSYLAASKAILALDPASIVETNHD